MTKSDLQDQIEMIIVKSNIALDATYQIMDLIEEYLNNQKT